MEISTPVLWRKVKKGNVKAFETLYKRCFPALCLYAHGLIPDYEIVKEIVNDVFLKIWNKRDEINIKYSVKPYLYRCVHNSCVDCLKLKKYNLNNQLFEISDKVKELTEDDGQILRQLSLDDLEKDVIKSIDKLPPKCKEIFLLSRYELLSHLEISKKLNISVNTVEIQISRALDSLRDSLRKYLM